MESQSGFNIQQHRPATHGLKMDIKQLPARGFILGLFPAVDEHASGAPASVCSENGGNPASDPGAVWDLGRCLLTLQRVETFSQD